MSPANGNPGAGDAGASRKIPRNDNLHQRVRFDHAAADKLTKILGLLVSADASGWTAPAANADALVPNAGSTWLDDHA